MKDKLENVRKENWDKELFKVLFNTPTTWYSLLISLLLVFPFMNQEDFFSWHEMLIAIVKVLISTALITVLYRLPALLINLQVNELDSKITAMEVRLDARITDMEDNSNTRITKMEKEISVTMGDNMNKIDKCPRLTAFNSANGSLKNKLDAMEAMKPNQRWMMSKFISKVLDFHFDSFIVEMKTRDYSLFSKEIMKECNKSVLLTGSMRPSTWLNKLANEDKSSDVERFFNNLYPIKKFPIGEGNHSLFLNQCEEIEERTRVVCLNPEDMTHLFISERSVDAYFGINNQQCGVKTFFTIWQDSMRKKMKPLKYEYALYDRTLLFKFDRENEQLTVINGNSQYENEDKTSEFNEVKHFFVDNTNASCPRRSYEEIILEIQKQKIRLLKRIQQTSLLPHKYSYLYGGADNWINYTKEKTKYGISSTIAIEKAIRLLLKERADLEIVEIGAGDGNRISTVCDAIGTNSIKEYAVVDISASLLKKAKSVLEERISKNKSKAILLDCCLRANQSRVQEVTKDKTVLVLSNSTLFQEDGFKWESFKQAKQILISIDLVKDDINTYEDLIKARKLFLRPLRIFEIPILDSIIDGLSDALFQRECKSVNDIFVEYNIFFNLKLYVNVLRYKLSNDLNALDRIIKDCSLENEVRSTIKNRIDEISGSDIPKESDEYVLFDYISDGKPLSEEYLIERSSFFEMENLKVLSCLKLKKPTEGQSKNENYKAYDNQVGLFFSELGFQAKTKIVNDSYIGILLTPSC